MSPNDQTAISTLKGVAVGSALLSAGSILTTSLHLIPSLLHATSSKVGGEEPSRSGRLTPQPSHQGGGSSNDSLLTPGTTFPLSKASSSRSTSYRLAAEQFGIITQGGWKTQAPLQGVAALSAACLAVYYYRGMGNRAGVAKWSAATVALLAGGVIEGGWMAPLRHKLNRIGGLEAPVEPYEDAPIDHEEERGNTDQFLRLWDGFNFMRGVLVLVAGGVGMADLVG
ncbi:hypothetical protein K470DRAFT_222103 [Piedraia hortae CBS 480.64]|uniref:DUF1772-domain-containing protein n=1 Tax=Piedraia hortae CBS 480.64 TaxID=1314780 RepID=A0A6A7BRY0_9PEZI|nr:hypothetical protein K470DRAFT_222103 [Piedraia hortae CBS 480.64]